MKRPEDRTTPEHIPLIVRLNREWARNRLAKPRPKFDPDPPVYGLRDPTWCQRLRFRFLGTWGDS